MQKRIRDFLKLLGSNPDLANPEVQGQCIMQSRLNFTSRGGGRGEGVCSGERGAYGISKQ